MDDKSIFNKPASPAPNAAQPSVATPTAPVSATPAPSAPGSTTRIPSATSGLLKKIIIGVVIFIIILVVVILFLPKGITQKKVSLVWWGLWEDARVTQSVIADFQKENPNITVEYIKQDPKQYRERLTTRVKNGTGPDIFRFHNTWYPMVYDFVSPLPVDVITVDDFKKNYYPVMTKDLVHNGAIYGIPLGADTLSLFANTEILNAAGVSVPTNWDEFVKAAKSLTVKDENKQIKTAGAAMGTYANITHAPDIISLLFVQQGIDINKFTSFEKDQIDVLDFYASFAKDNDNTWDSTLDSSIVAFSQGKLAMYFGYSWDIFTIQRLNKDLPFKVFAVPGLFNRKATIASYWADGVSNKSAHQKEAFLFMKHLAKKETAQKLYTEEAKTRNFGAPYARRDLASTLKDNELVYPFVEQLGNATSSYFVSDTFDGDAGLNSSSNTYLGNAINSITIDGSSTNTVVNTLNEGIVQVFNKYGIK